MMMKQTFATRQMKYVICIDYEIDLLIVSRHCVDQA